MLFSFTSLTHFVTSKNLMRLSLKYCFSLVSVNSMGLYNSFICGRYALNISILLAAMSFVVNSVVAVLSEEGFAVRYCFLFLFKSSISFGLNCAALLIVLSINLCKIPILISEL